MTSQKAKTVKRARKLRKEMTLPEVLLWREIRKRSFSLKFRRQHPIGPYVLDFYCAEAKLAIEIDGEAHDRGDRPERDAERDQRLEAKGIRTLRIPARDVLSDMCSVIERILHTADPELPLHQPTAGPPPHSSHGEDLA